MSVISFKNIKSLSELKKTNYIWQIKNDKDNDKSLSFFGLLPSMREKCRFFVKCVRILYWTLIHSIRHFRYNYRLHT